MNSIDLVIISIEAYRNPSFLTKDAYSKLDLSRCNIQQLDRYYKLISPVNDSLKKALKYVTYFDKFYPNCEEISNEEALQYHIYTYLQDLTILKNTLDAFLKVFERDITRKVTNKGDIKTFFDALRKSTHESFLEVLEHRNPYQHEGKKFLDNDVLDAGMYNTIIKAKEFMWDIVPDEWIEQALSKSKVAFDTAKAKYIQLAQANNDMLSKLVDRPFSVSQDYIYKILGIRSIDELKE